MGIYKTIMNNTSYRNMIMLLIIILFAIHHILLYLEVTNKFDTKGWFILPALLGLTGIFIFFESYYTK